MKSTLRFMGLCLLLCACSGPSGYQGSVRETLPRLSADSATVSLLQKLIDQNGGLQSFKGLGNLSLSRAQGQPQHLRMAIAAKTPDFLRVQMTTLFGQPAATLLIKNRQLTFVSNLKGKRYQADTEKLERSGLPIAMDVDQFLDMLMGRVPLKPFVHLAWVSDGAIKDYRVLVLKNRWHRTVQRLYFPLDDSRVKKIELFGNDGTLTAMLEITGWREVQSFQVPAALIVSNHEGERLTMEIQRFWANPQMSENLFNL